MAENKDVEALVNELVAGSHPHESLALLDALMNHRTAAVLEQLGADEEPTLHPVPDDVRGFRVRLDLHGAKPPVWRRLELPGDISLDRLHEVMQTAMGWHDGHLHRFRTGADYHSPHFVTPFDIDEGDDGTLESDVRLDQVIAARGDRLWYEYDFGDGWEHVLEVEKVLAEPPAQVRCIAGRMACPPEDCGGIHGYQELAAWVRSGYDDSALPEHFDYARHARDWLPVDWHPDHFDVEETDQALSAVLAQPVVLAGELAEFAAELERRGVLTLREMLRRPLWSEPDDISDAEAERLTEPYRVLLDAVGAGVTLTSAGFLPPAVVEQVAERSGITAWWIGKANREDLTPPVAVLRESARALGLITLRKGQLTPSNAALRCRRDAQALLRHIVGRLPIGTKQFDRHCGWMALTVVGSGTPVEEWDSEISDLLSSLGWQLRGDPYGRPLAQGPTLDVLAQLAGASRDHRRLRAGFAPAVAACARAAIQR